MTLIEKIAKALHDDLARESSGDGHKRYWETAPIQVKMLLIRQAQVAWDASEGAMSQQAYQVLGYLDEAIAGGGVSKPSGEEMIRAMDYFCGGHYDEEFLPWPRTEKDT